MTPASVPEGTVNITVKNTSGTARTVAVTGPNLTQPMTRQIKPNATGTLTLSKAKAGDYRVYVVGMEKKTGMSRTLKVTSAAVTPTGTQKPAMVTATLTSSKLTVTPTTIPEGNVDLSVHNNGTAAQTVAVTGPGLQKPMTRIVQPKKTATISLTNAQAGSYRIYVVGKEKKTGMSQTLTVTSATPSGTGGTEGANTRTPTSAPATPSGK